MTISRSRRAEATHLRTSPFNRLSFHYVNHHANSVWSVPPPAAGASNLDLGQRMADELFDALEEARRAGEKPQSHFAYLVTQAEKRITDPDIRAGFLCGINDRLNLLLGFDMSPAPWQTPETVRRLLGAREYEGQDQSATREVA